MGDVVRKREKERGEKEEDFCEILRDVNEFSRVFILWELLCAAEK